MSNISGFISKIYNFVCLNVINPKSNLISDTVDRQRIQNNI